jgi:hypothetical protein
MTPLESGPGSLLKLRLVVTVAQPIVPSDGAGGVAVVLRLGGRSSFFNYGWADRGNEKPVTTDSLFNLASREISWALSGTNTTPRSVL